MKNKLLPRIIKLTFIESVRHNALTSLKEIYKIFDGTSCIEIIIPAMSKIRSLGITSKSNLLLLEIY